MLHRDKIRRRKSKENGCGLSLRLKVYLQFQEVDTPLPLQVLHSLFSVVITMKVRKLVLLI